MGNEPRTLSASGLVVRHVPEPDETYDAAAHDDPNHITGFVDVGTIIDGVFVVLLRRKASGLFADIERAKSSPSPPEAPSE